MSGNDKHRLIVQPRDQHLLRELAVTRIIDREQAKYVAGFASTTRANARLLALVRAGLLRRFFIASHAGGKKALYALSVKGAQLVGVPYRGLRRPQNQMLVADFTVEHQLAVNDLYSRLKYEPIPITGVTFSRWLAFHEPVTPSLRLIPDGYVELATPSGIIAAFLEVDLGTEILAVWKEKARKYLELALSGDAVRRFGDKRFRVLVIANSERRALSIRTALSTITQKIFWFARLTDARRDFFGAIWRRPVGASLESFFKDTL